MKYKLILSLIFSIFLISLVSSEANWAMYGGNDITMNSLQSPNFRSDFQNRNVSATTINAGFSGNGLFEPLVSTLASESQSYIIFQNGNYLEFYNQYGSLVNEQFVGMTLSSPLVIGDFDADNKINDVAGIWAINTTDLSFRIYNFNYSNSAITLKKESNQSLGGVGGSVGLRAMSRSLNNSKLDTIFYWWNGNNYTNYHYQFAEYGLNFAHQLPQTNQIPVEALSAQDVNNNGVLDYLMYAGDKAVLFSELGNVITEVSNSSGNIRWARLFKSDATPLYRILVVYDNIATCSGQYHCVRVQALKTDGTQIWLNEYSAITSGDFIQFSNPAIYDYGNNHIDDIFFTYADVGVNSYTKYLVLKGNDGSVLYTINAQVGMTKVSGGASQIGLRNSLGFLETTGDFPDFVSFGNINITFFSPNTNTTLYNETSWTNPTNCIPVDAYLDGALDVVCQSNTKTKLYKTNFTRQNVIINNFTLSPSASISVSQPLTIFIQSTNPQNDFTFYFVDCGNGINTSVDFNPTKSCVYSAVGTYPLVVYARDLYFPTYASSSPFNIYVTNTGSLCNFNAVCEPSLGESMGNCPSDCVSGNGQVIQTTNDSLSIPLKLVDTENNERGLLPTIYYGILGFVSGSFKPILIIILIAVCIMLITAVFGLLVKAMFGKVGR